MILRQVAYALAARREATLSQVAAEVGASRAMVAECLDWWRRRGQVSVTEALPAAGHCGRGCGGCPIVDACDAGDLLRGAAVFTWKGRERPVRARS